MFLPLPQDLAGQRSEISLKRTWLKKKWNTSEDTMKKKRIPKQRYGESFQTFISASYIFEKELKRWFQIVKLGVAFRFVKEMCLSEALFMSLPEALHDMFPISFLHLHPIPIPVQNTRTGVLSVLPRGREMEGNSKNGTNDIEITLMFLKFI